MNKTKSALVLY